jgi:hypothetical protein
MFETNDTPNQQFTGRVVQIKNPLMIDTLLE